MKQGVVRPYAALLVLGALGGAAQARAQLPVVGGPASLHVLIREAARELQQLELLLQQYQEQVDCDSEGPRCQQFVEEARRHVFDPLWQGPLPGSARADLLTLLSAQAQLAPQSLRIPGRVPTNPSTELP